MTAPFQPRPWHLQRLYIAAKALAATRYLRDYWSGNAAARGKKK